MERYSFFERTIFRSSRRPGGLPSLFFQLLMLSLRYAAVITWCLQGDILVLKGHRRARRTDGRTQVTLVWLFFTVLLFLISFSLLNRGDSRLRDDIRRYACVYVCASFSFFSLLLPPSSVLFPPSFVKKRPFYRARAAISRYRARDN